MARVTMGRWRLATTMVLIWLAGVVGAGIRGQAQEPPRVAPPPETMKDYVLSPSDVIAIKFLNNPELNEQLPIRPDGKIALQIVGEIRAAGLSPAELRTQLVERYSTVVKHPELVVVVQTFGTQKVYVGGEVGRPGEIAFTPGMTTLQAIIMAGGDRRTASARNVVIVRDQGTDIPLVLLVDIKKLVSSKDVVGDIRLQPRDIVFVPMSKIAKVGNFMTQYVKDVIPMSLVLGLYYNFNGVIVP